jgi:hypothetical protein
MKKIQPYQIEVSKKQQPEKKPQESQEEEPKLEKIEERKDEEEKEEEKEEERKEEIETIPPIQPIQPIEPIEPAQTIQPILQQERVVRNSRVSPIAKSGLLLTVSGAATGMAAIAFEQSIFLAAGTIGVTAGAVLLTAAAATGVFNGLSWAVERARGIRA